MKLTAEKQDLVLGLVDQRALLDPRHHVAELGADLFDVVFGEALDEYGKPEVGGRTGGKQPTGPDGHWLEPMTTLSVVAGATSNVRLGTQILLAALRRPVILAKTTATLDVLSGGRLDLGVGVGWQKAEYDAAGLSFEKRGRLLDHTLEVCQTLWTEMRASYTAPELTFDGIHQCPKPTRPEGVPVWISGTIRDTTVRRLVRFGLRWIPWGADDLNMIDSLPRMKDAIAKAADHGVVLGHDDKAVLAAHGFQNGCLVQRLDRRGMQNRDVHVISAQSLSHLERTHRHKAARNNQDIGTVSQQLCLAKFEPIPRNLIQHQWHLSA